MPADLATILKIEVPVIVQIGSRQMPAQDVVGFYRVVLENPTVATIVSSEG